MKRYAVILVLTGSIGCARVVFPADPGDAASDAAADASMVSPPRALEIAAGPSHTCARFDDRAVRCWGDNRVGELGTGDVFDRFVPTRVDGLENTNGLAAGGIRMDLSSDPAGSASASCVVASDRTVRCWGIGFVTRSSRPSVAELPEPSVVTIAGLHDVRRVAVGGGFACALDETGVVQCWGSNGYQTLGDGTTESRFTPAPVSGLPPVIDLVAGTTCTCARTSDGSVYCWGSIVPGWIGGTPVGTPGVYSVPTRMEGISNATGVAVGSTHICVLLADGSVRCWGENGLGELGDGTTERRSGIVGVHALTHATSIAAAGYHTCAVLEDGTMRCWGSSVLGESGIVPDSHSAHPGMVLTPADPGLRGVTAIALGELHTCAADRDGLIQCFGANASGALGNDSRSGAPQPQHRPVVFTSRDAPDDPITPGTPVHLVAGKAIECAVTSAGTVRCWGSNLHGQLGDRSLHDRFVPIEVHGLRNVTEVSIGGFNSVGGGMQGIDASHVCARLMDGTVACWGANESSQLGDGMTADRTTPVVVNGIANVVHVAAGGGFTCTLDNSGVVSCWGDASDGAVGRMSTSPQRTPWRVGGLQLATAISAGLDHACALSTGGGVQCWGANRGGQLGDGTRQGGAGPVTVTLPRRAIAITTADEHSCALLEDATAWCWGRGVVTDPMSASSDSAVPVRVSGIDDIVELRASSERTCARRRDGTMWCWGSGLWDPNLTETVPRDAVPTQVADVRDAAEIAIGQYQHCVLTTRGEIDCAGFNWFGALGDGSRTSRLGIAPTAW